MGDAGSFEVGFLSFKSKFVLWIYAVLSVLAYSISLFVIIYPLGKLPQIINGTITLNWIRILIIPGIGLAFISALFFIKEKYFYASYKDRFMSTRDKVRRLLFGISVADSRIDGVTFYRYIVLILAIYYPLYIAVIITLFLAFLPDRLYLLFSELSYLPALTMLFVFSYIIGLSKWYSLKQFKRIKNKPGTPSHGRRPEVG